MATMSRVTSVTASLVHGVQLLGTLFILAIVLAKLRSPPASLVSSTPSLPADASCGLASTAADTGLCDGLAALVGATWAARLALALLGCLTCCLCCVPDVLEAVGGVVLGVTWAVAASLVAAAGPATAGGGWTWPRAVLVAAWVVAGVSLGGGAVAALGACGWCVRAGAHRRRGDR